MTETEYIQNLRIALDELNRWFRHIDNFYWALSSFLLIGTGVAVAKALEWWNGENWKIIIVGFIMIVGWILFLLFDRNISKKIEFYFKRANNLEKELKIDILPEQLFKKYGLQFNTIMKIVAYLSILICSCFIIIIQFIEKNLCNLCH